MLIGRIRTQVSKLCVVVKSDSGTQQGWVKYLLLNRVVISRDELPISRSQELQNKLSSTILLISRGRSNKPKKTGNSSFRGNTNERLR